MSGIVFVYLVIAAVVGYGLLNAAYQHGRNEVRNEHIDNHHEELAARAAADRAAAETPPPVAMSEPYVDPTTAAFAAARPPGAGFRRGSGRPPGAGRSAPAIPANERRVNP